MISKRSIPVNCPICGRDKTKPLFDRQGYQHVECTNCSMIYVNPQPEDAVAVNAYLFGHQHPEWSQGPNRFYGLDDAGKREYLNRTRKHPMKKYVRELAFLKTSFQLGRLLDVGCADGRFMLAAEGAGWQTSGVEVAPENAGLCRDGLGLDVHCGTLEQAQLEKGSFDAVRLNQVIEHVAKPLELLGQIHHALRPGGFLSLSTVNIRSFTYSILGRNWSYLGADRNGHINFFSRATLGRALEECGFKPLRWTTTGCRLRNPGTLGKNISGRFVRTMEKALGPWPPWRVEAAGFMSFPKRFHDRVSPPLAGEGLGA